MEVSESHQNNNIKALAAFAHFLGSSINFKTLRNMIQYIISRFKLKGTEYDPDRKA